MTPPAPPESDIRDCAAGLVANHDTVEDAQVVAGDDGHEVWLTVAGSVVPPAVQIRLGECGLGIDPDRTATRREPVTTNVVAVVP
jgi:hypothetical protein